MLSDPILGCSRILVRVCEPRCGSHFDGSVRTDSRDHPRCELDTERPAHVPLGMKMNAWTVLDSVCTERRFFPGHEEYRAKGIRRGRRRNTETCLFLHADIEIANQTPSPAGCAGQYAEIVRHPTWRFPSVEFGSKCTFASTSEPLPDFFVIMCSRPTCVVSW